MKLRNKRLGLLATALIMVPILGGCGTSSTPTTAPAAAGPTDTAERAPPTLSGAPTRSPQAHARR